MVAKTLKSTLVCWPKPRVDASVIGEATIFRAGETVRIDEREAGETLGRIPVLVRGKTLYCNSEQFWRAVEH